MLLPTLLRIIAEYVGEYRLRPWVAEVELRTRPPWRQDGFQFNYLSGNTHPAAIKILRENIEHIDGAALAMNPAARELILAFPNIVSWAHLPANPAMIDILSDSCEDYLDRVKCYRYSEPERIKREYWYWLSINPAAGHILRRNPDKVRWGMAGANPAVIDLLLANRDKVQNYDLCRNPAFDIHSLSEELWRFDALSENPNPAAMEIICRNLDKISWNRLAGNRAAIQILKANHEKIPHAQFLLQNPAIFESSLDILLRNSSSPASTSSSGK